MVGMHVASHHDHHIATVSLPFQNGWNHKANEVYMSHVLNEVVIVSKLVYIHQKSDGVCPSGRLAQLVERELCMLKVVGSIPSSSNLFFTPEISRARDPFSKLAIDK